MKIATWNVNSAKARLPVVTDWLRAVSHLISWSSRTSGRAAASQPTTLGRRAFTELTFQVAIFMAGPGGG